MIIKANGFGKFEATNGLDVVTAEFERGKRVEGKFHTHWNLLVNGKKKTYYVGKDEIMEIITNLLTKAIPAPLSTTETKRMFEEDGEVHGIVDCSINELIGSDLDDVLDMLNDRLSEESLCDLKYRVVGASEDGVTIQIRVSGKL